MDTYYRRTVAYYRSSSELQENSIDYQRDQAVRLAIKLGFTIDEEYEDQSVSARKLRRNNRPRMADLYRDIENGTVGTLLVYKRDRLARQVDEYLQIYYLCKKHNVNIILTAEGDKEITYDYMGDFFEHIMAGFVELEADNIHERLEKARLTKFLNGDLWVSMPFGYEMDPTSKVIKQKPELLQVSKKIFNEILENDHDSLNELRKYINTKGLRRKDKEWNVANLTKMLKHPLYKGVHSVNIGGNIQIKILEELAILSEEDWSRVQEKLKAMSPSRGETKPTGLFLLDNLLRCQNCLDLLQVRYRTINNERQIVYTCKKHTTVLANQQEVEKYVVEFVRNMIYDYLRQNWFIVLKDKITKQRKESDAKIKVLQKDLEKQTINLAPVIDEWMSSSNESDYNKLLALHDEYDENRKNFYRLISEERRKVIELETAKENFEIMKEEYIMEYIQAAVPEKMKELLQDVITSISVNSDLELEICAKLNVKFKPPFFVEWRELR